MKQRTKSISRIIRRFEQALIGAARVDGYDGVICGHIHKAEIKTIEGLLYMNCGDWVDSCTALVEDLSGDFRTIYWLAEQQGKRMKRTKKTRKLKKKGLVESTHV